MINLIFIFFICLMNIGGEKGRLTDYFGHFRRFISLLIVSPLTINVSETTKLKKWPNENQYEEIGPIIHSILFNYIYFLNDKLQNLKKQEKKYNSNSESGNDSDKKNMESILILKKIYMENLGYILKVLNGIYQGVNQKNDNWNIFKGENKINKIIKKSGAYSFIKEFYEQGLNNRNKEELVNKNNLNKNVNNFM